MMKGWGITDKGSVRQQNQDGYYLDIPSDSLAVAVVCDGMGGARAGNIASLLAVESFVDCLQNVSDSDNGETPADLLLRAAEEANHCVYERALHDPDCMGMGTTMVATVVTGNHADILNIGDSRMYAVNEEGITRLTRDHSVVEEMVARGELTPEEARNHPRKNLITRALGAEKHIRADRYARDLADGEYLLLCSDGLSNQLSDQEILFEILHGGDNETCCARMLQIALDRGAPDNVTAVLLRNENKED